MRRVGIPRSDGGYISRSLAVEAMSKWDFVGLWDRKDEHSELQEFGGISVPGAVAACR